MMENIENVTAFVFTNYNNSKFTQSALESLSRSDAKNCPVVIVDNASNEENKSILKVLESSYKNLSVIYNEKNEGYFPGLNIGIKWAKEHTPAKIMVIGNNDLEFPPGFLGQISAKLPLLEKYPVVSPNITTLDGLPQNPHVIHGISKFREMIYDLYHMNYYLAKAIVKIANLTHSFTDRKDEQHHAEAMEIVQGYGACYIIGPAFFRFFTELWSPTFLMYEEYFLSMQLARKGFKFFYEPSIHVKHHCHAATGQLPGKLRWEYSRKAHREYRKYVRIL